MKTDDIDAMFAAAASAGEDTGEGDVSNPTSNNTKVEQKFSKEKESTVQKVAPQKPTETNIKKEPVEKIVQQERTTKVEQNVNNKAEVSRKPLASGKSIATGNITENSISKILEMNKNFNSLNDTEKEFVSGYFQIDNSSDSISEIIYQALIANENNLDALNKIVIARKETAAERAFYLMELDNSSIEAIYEQVELLTGELGQISRVDSANKINICRKIEKTIAEMPNNVFAYIDKLQAFTSIAIDK